ncbi:hypothetical protein FRB90_007054 [Tulasnella sp. 427]|nr:hypothetical protein FRB90_007054 [Tulasnella sp. 427]
MVIAIMSCVSNMATLITNAPDFASRANTPSAAVWPQIFGIPLGFSIVSFLGIIVSSSSTVIYGEPVWNPIDLLGKLLDGHPSGATRFGVWFISASFILAQLGTNIAANSVSAGCDLTALFPRFINIRRGGYVAAIVGLVMCPWNLLKDSNSFTSYLSAYSVFLSSIAGVMISEYWFIRRGHYRVADLYHTGRDGWYWYTFGINWRAYAAYISGILINVVGFAGAVGRTVPLGATRVYQLSFFTGFGVSALIYCTLTKLFPTPGSWQPFEEIDESDYKARERDHVMEDSDDDKKGSGASVDVKEVKVVYKPDSQSTDEYMAIVNGEEYQKWLEVSLSIPLALVVDSYDIFHSGQGAQGILGKASKQEIETVFGVKKDVDALEILLSKGTLQTGERLKHFGTTNDSRGARITSAGASGGGR